MKHRPELKPDPLSRANLIAWIASQPADDHYEFGNGERCLLGQWTKSIDSLSYHVSAFIYQVGREEVNLSHFHEIAKGLSEHGTFEEWTFGAALDRAASILTTGKAE